MIRPTSGETRHLRAGLEETGNNPRTLLNLRRRMSRIRVFDPACGSGNFLVTGGAARRADVLKFR
jgi:hypothetical protein